MFTPFVTRNTGQFFVPEMDRLFDAFLNPFPAQSPAAARHGSRFPALNVWEDPDAYHLEAEIPGMSSEDLEVVVLGNEVTIKGERKETQSEGGTVHRRERTAGRFSRVVQLPADINADAVEATVASGVLTLRLPKAESAKPKRITIQN